MTVDGRVFKQVYKINVVYFPVDNSSEGWCRSFYNPYVLTITKYHSIVVFHSLNFGGPIDIMYPEGTRELGKGGIREENS